ncbi:hypothetical protein K2173_001224 [Erythroxylum novogranatense]|uniref:DNA repair protein RAD4 n=1 Tax=Erythroxylum novogranatense TaxID=1862640 RepID=A0AAV8T4N8_9ROSI|nr:hypothetical protein K2173_001224 [Erythroxylum novogranatense]
MDDTDWEDGYTPVLDSTNNHPGDSVRKITLEFTEPTDSTKRKPIRRASAEEKEVAELVHKVHLLCLLARGRIIDNACDDPLIQASLLSLVPAHLLKISELSKLAANSLSHLVSWFHNNFHVRGVANESRSFKSALASALENREGTPEEISALSVALLRALKLTTRYVSILDVVSLKPDANNCESSSQDGSRVCRSLFNTTTVMVDRAKENSESPVKSLSGNEENIVHEHSLKISRSRSEVSNSKSKKCLSHDSYLNGNVEDQTVYSSTCDTKVIIPEDVEKSQGIKRKGDVEFETQLQMALSATAAAITQNGKGLNVDNSKASSSNVSSPVKRVRRNASEDSSYQGISTAVGSRKIGSPLHWAEVYCSGENLDGKWVHVDAVNDIIDGEQKVEAAADACRTSLRYVVAFAGDGAKDVTRRYCMKWYKISPKRIDSVWWDRVLAPLRVLESGAIGGSSTTLSFVGTRSSLEDMELETRALTEPLPTNQQAYRNHPLYTIEKWLTKCQILYPKGPILGFCSGNPVYPRTCLQSLKTRERWMREGLQVKANEFPAKVLKESRKLKKAQPSEDVDSGQAGSKGMVELYGKWQLEPLELPHAVNGNVPKNERGQVDVWSEKCLPPGTVHLRLPRVFNVAKRLEIDYAPAMVGFEFRSGRCIPVFDGIVVCTEFKDAILEAYAEEEQLREAEEKKRNERQALTRWYQLLSSIITRQRLKNSYGTSLPSELTSSRSAEGNLFNGNHDNMPLLGSKEASMQDSKSYAPFFTQAEEHEHVFLAEDQSFDAESSTRIKRCPCGFSIQVEEL